MKHHLFPLLHRETGYWIRKDLQLAVWQYSNSDWPLCLNCSSIDTQWSVVLFVRSFCLCTVLCFYKCSVVLSKELLLICKLNILDSHSLCMLCDLPLSLRNLGICNEKPIRRLSLLQVLCYCMNFYQLCVSFLSPTERSKGLTWFYRKSSGEKSLLVTCCRQEKLWWPNALLQTNMCIMF